MKPFVMDSKMTTMRGVFYPTGHIVLMLPSHDDAHKAAHALLHVGIDDNEISVLPPELFMDQIAHTADGADSPLPSPGTEADTVRQMTHLAAQGQWGLMVHAPKAADGERVVKALKGMPVSYAQKYRQLVIEDIAVE
ncbi:MAG TPA: hypothetical protein VLJ86_21275 [Ramlibacter sp.]|nr:hypothetical protein [Ramlibacter sp.]